MNTANPPAVLEVSKGDLFEIIQAWFNDNHPHDTSMKPQIRFTGVRPDVGVLLTGFKIEYMPKTDAQPNSLAANLIRTFNAIPMSGDSQDLLRRYNLTYIWQLFVLGSKELMLIGFGDNALEELISESGDFPDCDRSFVQELSKRFYAQARAYGKVDDEPKLDIVTRFSAGAELAAVGRQFILCVVPKILNGEE